MTNISSDDAVGRGIDREAELDDTNYQIREMFAQYGLAMYLSSVLEASMINVLTLAQTTASGIGTPALFDDYFLANSTVSMGRLLKRLAPFLLDMPGLHSRLDVALEERNRFAHHFYRDHDRDHMSTPGREVMLAEAFLAQELFTDTTKLLEPLVATYLALRGVPLGTHEARVEALMVKFREEAATKYVDDE
ncbi:hypothetical protein RCH12_003116 [Cryobacterium sp. MP_3.1]|uniref:hypothetical protein n=1 Tax=Cryobacterium sp. MP_3.1 TaxID=3071711 RepID=UPI002E0C9DEA|nr:hypothetical protein [Cryobacterium sp. MP_3.1]